MIPDQDPQVTKREIKLSAEIARLHAKLDGYENFTWPNGESEDAAQAAIRLQAEVERLREEAESWHVTPMMSGGIVDWKKTGEFLKARLGEVEAALTAHQAVVRELAEALEAAQNSLYASTDYQKVPSNRYGLERIRAALAHPLVVAARKAP